MSQAHYFIGVHTSNEVQNHLQTLQQEASLTQYYRKLTYVNDFHLTLLFLGGWESEKRRNLWSALQEQGPHLQPFQLTLSEVGMFGNKTLPRVYWVGVEKNDALFKFQSLVEQQAKSSDFPVQDRPFRPHITLGKGLKDSKVKEVPQKVNVKPLSWDIRQLNLYKVKPGEKPMYEIESSIYFSHPRKKMIKYE
ncbi:RNA 2',3'-cyclic phosphodiesterase [Bacillus shivajii]|uniref:RNA 2',3'-cyclic phosphodiesterase n=1 Tax=Bacillus shivajii TaxID=1983719 RepID=UPI001CFA9CDB|nr:RNA 2',3'-cyclic phosphodiesterase [Bacillus shivajii]UCZ52334.1 RNA 2',3'-cyclic phosphodiesterase [Bacillus shivajii]